MNDIEIIEDWIKRMENDPNFKEWVALLSIKSVLSTFKKVEQMLEASDEP